VIEYFVHFEKGFVVGARSRRMINVEANDAQRAVLAACRKFNEYGYRLISVDHFEDGRLVTDAFFD